MIRSPEELSKPIKLAVNRRAVVFSHILLALAVVIHTWLAPETPPYQRVTAVALGVGFVILVLLRFFDLAKLNSKPRTYLVFYMIIIFIGIAFLSDPATPYALGAFIIVFLLNLYYGSKGVMFGIAFFTVTTIVKYIFTLQTFGLTDADKLNIVVTLVVFVAVGSMFINIQKVYDWDRARLHDTIKEAIIEQKRLRALINNMTESVLVLDKSGVIRLYNAAALALFNTNNSLSDKPLDGFVKLEDSTGKIITTADLLPPSSKPIIRSDIVIRYSQDDTASLSIISTPIRSTFGQEREEEGYVITMRDITREKSLEEERDEFISVISHELRTPVTVAEAGISNALFLSSRIAGNEKITKSLQTAHDQSVFLANMLNDLSTFARAEKGTLDMNLEEFTPRELLETLRDDYNASIEAKGMHIKIELDPSTPLLMASNRLYLREILQNFITNAIKYSDKGTITLMARAKDKGILYSVADEGIGISVSDQKKVFEKFFRTEDYRTRSTNGTGLGLYIVKKLAKILDASFEIQSEVGKGSVFSIYVPDKSDVLTAKKAADAAPVATTHQAVQPTAADAAPSNDTQTPLPVAANPVASAISPDATHTTAVPQEVLPKQG